MRSLVFFAVLCLSCGPVLAAAKAKPAPKPKPLPPVRYVCEDGTRLSVQFSAPDATAASAVLRILGTGKELILARAASADGGRYTGDKVEFWDKGQTASFTQDGKPLSCRPKR